PRNLVGSPRHRAAESTRIGTVLPEGSNFNFAAPIVSLGGRGIGANLTLYYNSRLWSRRNNSMAYNAIVGWPAPGFSLGFGRIDDTKGAHQIQSLSLQTVSFPGTGSAPTNRITSVTNSGTTVTYAYDANGNVTNDGAHSYAYDSENRLVSVDGGATASYGYDQQNRRYKTTVASTVTHYIW